MISKTSPVTDQQRIHEQLDKGQLKLNLTPPELIEHALAQKEGWLTDTGALMADTGKFTGRSPKDRYIVSDYKTKNTIWWGKIGRAHV